MAVTIGSDPEIRAGKYTFWQDGKPTRAWVGDVLRSLRNGNSAADLKDWHPWLTDEMIAAAQAFDWPAQYPRPEAATESIEVRCVCGEWVDFAHVDTDEAAEILACVCGRKWTVRIVVEAPE